MTYLIPKGVPKQRNDYRPITCMSNFYKLTTKLRNASNAANSRAQETLFRKPAWYGKNGPGSKV